MDNIDLSNKHEHVTNNMEQNAQINLSQSNDINDREKSITEN